MNDEDAFNAALDAHPEDSATRCAYADYLIERGDPRGEGYAVLGVYGRDPVFLKSFRQWGYYGGWGDQWPRHFLPWPWLRRGNDPLGPSKSWMGVEPSDGCRTRREAEEDMATRWALMTEVEKQQCLALLTAIPSVTLATK